MKIPIKIFVFIVYEEESIEKEFNLYLYSCQRVEIIFD